MALKVVPTKREVIQNRVLIELNDRGKVAILATEEDLMMIIRSLDKWVCSTVEENRKRTQFTADLRQLFDSAFGD